MTKEHIIRCDRCGSTEEDPDKVRRITRHPHKARYYKAEKDSILDLCGRCGDAFDKWISKDNATRPGQDPSMEEVCHHHVPCGGPCSDPSYRKIA